MTRPGRVLLSAALVTALIFVAQGFSAGWAAGTLLSALLTAVALVLVREGTGASSRLLNALTIAWLYWGLSYVSNLIEALVFGVIPFRAAGVGAGFGLLLAVAAAGLLEACMPHSVAAASEAKTRPARGLAWRIPLLAFAFFVIYLLAGLAIQPWIMSFYAHRHLPTLGQLLILQLGRGAFDLACILPVFYAWRGSRGRAMWTSSYVFTVLCGWGPLLLPNQFMPGSIRLAHAMEMGASGVVFGSLAAWMLLRSRKAQGRAPVAS